MTLGAQRNNCPHQREVHWIKWGFYWRYAQGKRERIPVQRFWCRLMPRKRTFSLLPDGLLPYRHAHAGLILRYLKALFLRHRPASAYADRRDRPRTTVRRAKAAFARIAPLLRLPGQEGALAPELFLRRLFALTAERIAEIFRDWKELEPKHSVVGIYSRG